MNTGVTVAMQALLDAVERVEREGLRAHQDATRMAAVNNDLCDELHTAKARVRELETALRWFADEGHYHGTYRHGAGYVDAVGLSIARGALLGISPDDEDSINDAWEMYQAEAAAE